MYSCHVRIETGTCVLLENKISVLVRVRVIKTLVVAHSCFNSYTPELIPLFYSAIKHGYQSFISLSNLSNYSSSSSVKLVMFSITNDTTIWNVLYTWVYLWSYGPKKALINRVLHWLYFNKWTNKKCGKVHVYSITNIASLLFEIMISLL